MWNAKCKDNVAGLGRATSSPTMRIRPNGTFGWTERYTENYGRFVARITSTHNRPVRALDRLGDLARARRRAKRADEETRRLV